MISEKTKPLVNNNSAIRAMSREGKRLATIHGAENVYDFSLGNPNVSAPAEVNQAVCDILKEEESTYVHGHMSNTGYEDIRQAVAESLNKRFGTQLHQNNILMIVGTASGLDVILETLLNSGDKVTAFVPYFMEYGNYTRNYDGNPVVISPDTTNFEPNLAGFEQKTNEKTKTAIINTPNNPIGVVYSLETLTEVADITRVKEKELRATTVLLPDEPYRELAYDGVDVPYATNVYDSIVICYSYSKFLSLLGERTGYLAILDALKDNGEVFSAAVIANRVLGCANAPSLMQRVILRRPNVKVNLEAYDRNGNLLYNDLKDLGFECIKPQGAFYPLVKSPEADEKKFCENCKKYNILVAPETSSACPSYVRIFYCVFCEQIECSLPAFAKVAVDYGLTK